jgi:hypothetical protein
MARPITIAGIHLGGAHTKKTAVVRASFVPPENLTPDSLNGWKHSTDWHLNSYFTETHSHSHFSSHSHSPLLWEAISSSIGPSPRRSGDERLCDVLKDFGNVDIFCIDAPFSPPHCLPCDLPCPGTQRCPVPGVQGLNRLAAEAVSKKHRKSPLPYMDRYLDAFFRTELDDHRPQTAKLLGHDLEPCLGSNRAPLFARATQLKRYLTQMSPSALILESNGALSELGWSHLSKFPFGGEGLSRSPLGGTGVRGAMLRRLETAQFATRHASLDPELFLEFQSNPGVFFAALSALSAWGLFHGFCFLPNETNEFLPGSEPLSRQNPYPLEGWICVPKESVAAHPHFN